MKANNGDQITVRGRKVGDPERQGVVIDVRGSDGDPPYMVMWENDTEEHLVFPGSDAVITAKGKR